MGDDVRQLVGIVFVTVGILDPLVGIFIVGPRIADERRRQVVVFALVGSGATLVTLGALFLTGVLGR